MIATPEPMGVRSAPQAIRVFIVEDDRLLRDSLVHAAEDMEERLLSEARVEARGALHALDAALRGDGDLLDAAERAALDAERAAVEAAIAGADRDAVHDAVAALEEASRPFAERRMDRGIRAALAGVDLDTLADRIG